MENKIPLITVTGPTAAGKSAAGVSLALAIGGEIVSADSMQIYKRMDIGTAKPTMAERNGVPHHLIDIIEPYENFSVADYAKQAHGVIADIHSRGKIPVLVGGTGLYINSVTRNVDFTEIKKDEDYRAALKSIAQEKGNHFLYNMLKKIDPPCAAKLHPNDIRRVCRALEVYHITGVTMSQHQKNALKTPEIYNNVKFALYYERKKLYDIIDKRVDNMMHGGLVDEVTALMEDKLENCTSMQGIGYKEIVNYLCERAEYDETVDEIKKASRRYAKRQFTFFRADRDIIWMENDGGALEKMSEILRRKNNG